MRLLNSLIIDSVIDSIYLRNRIGNIEIVMVCTCVYYWLLYGSMESSEMFPIPF